MSKQQVLTIKATEKHWLDRLRTIKGQATLEQNNFYLIEISDKEGDFVVEKDTIFLPVPDGEDVYGVTALLDATKIRRARALFFPSRVGAAVALALSPLIWSGALAPKEVTVWADVPLDEHLLRKEIGAFPIRWQSCDSVLEGLNLSLRVPDGWSNRDLWSAYYHAYQGKKIVLCHPTEIPEQSQVPILTFEMDRETDEANVKIWLPESFYEDEVRGILQYVLEEYSKER